MASQALETSQGCDLEAAVAATPATEGSLVHPALPSSPIRAPCILLHARASCLCRHINAPMTPQQAIPITSTTALTPRLSNLAITTPTKLDLLQASLAFPSAHHKSNRILLSKPYPNSNPYLTFCPDPNPIPNPNPNLTLNPAPFTI